MKYIGNCIPSYLSFCLETSVHYWQKQDVSALFYHYDIFSWDWITHILSPALKKNTPYKLYNVQTMLDKNFKKSMRLCF